MAERTVLVQNLTEINRALNATKLKSAQAMRNGLLEAAEPIRQDAGRLSQLELSGMKRAKKKPPPWSIQKKGQTVSEVYIAPKERGNRYRTTKGDIDRAQKFVALMMGKAYEPALARNEQRSRLYVDNWLSSVTRDFNARGV